jgi:DNA-binding NtrC family response regulator
MPVLMEHNWPGNVRELENSAASVAADAHAAGLQ